MDDTHSSSSLIAVQKSVTVDTPARLHLGFLDLHGGLGRQFGSIGVAIDGLSTCVTVSDAPSMSIQGLEQRRAQRYAECFLEAIDLPTASNVRVEVHSAIPSHAGLGSGTQLALAIGSAIDRLFARDSDLRELASVGDRGLRSGIGIATFEHGGFVVDMGRGPKTRVPPALGKVRFPPDWAITLIWDDADAGISGEREKSAFSALEPMPEGVAAAICRHTLMGIVPALIEEDFESFARSMDIVQVHVGDHFAPQQGGRRYTSRRVEAAIDKIKARFPMTASGQTSWGPTGFIFSPHRLQAEEIAALIDTEFSKLMDTRADQKLRATTHHARNLGATIETTSQ